MAPSANKSPPSVSLLYLGQTALMLEYLVLRECHLLFKIKCSFRLYFPSTVGGLCPVSPCCTIRGKEVQPLAALYPTVRLSPWRQVRKISTPGCAPPVPPDLYSTDKGHPSWFPLVPSDWGIWASPPETDQDSCTVWLPLVPLDLVSPQI